MSEHTTLFLTLARPIRLSGRFRTGVAAFMALLTAGIAFALVGGVETAKVAPPVTVELKLDSRLPAYDIAWSDHRLVNGKRPRENAWKWVRRYSQED